MGEERRERRWESGRVEGREVAMWENRDFRGTEGQMCSPPPYSWLVWLRGVGLRGRRNHE